MEYAREESGDYDFVTRWVEGDAQHFCPVQLKELVPEDLNPATSLSDLIAGLGKYSTKTSTALAVKINRRSNLTLPTMPDIAFSSCGCSGPPRRGRTGGAFMATRCGSRNPFHSPIPRAHRRTSMVLTASPCLVTNYSSDAVRDLEDPASHLEWPSGSDTRCTAILGHSASQRSPPYTPLRCGPAAVRTWFSTLGWPCKLAGLGLVAAGIHETRKRFGRPSIWESFRKWLADLKNAVLLPPITASGSGTASVTGTGSAMWTGFAPTVITDQEERLRALEVAVDDLQKRLAKLISVSDQTAKDLRAALADEATARQQSEKETRLLIQEQAVGGLHLEMMGLVWLLVAAFWGGRFPHSLRVSCPTSRAPSRSRSI